MSEIDELKTLLFAAAEIGMAHPDHMKDYVHSLVLPYVDDAKALITTEIEAARQEGLLEGATTMRDRIAINCDDNCNPQECEAAALLSRYRKGEL